MDKDRISQMKQDFMEPYWTESSHLKLQEFSDSDAKEIVESMESCEIFSKVNYRRHQQDYIADYIEYLWEISEDAYWNHVISSLNADSAIGLLWSDNMSHIEKMCEVELPDRVLQAVLAFIEETTSENDLDAISNIIKVQINRFSKQEAINNHIATLLPSIGKSLSIKIDKLLALESSYKFY